MDTLDKNRKREHTFLIPPVAFSIRLSEDIIREIMTMVESKEIDLGHACDIFHELNYEEFTRINAPLADRVKQVCRKHPGCENIWGEAYTMVQLELLRKHRAAAAQDTLHKILKFLNPT